MDKPLSFDEHRELGREVSNTRSRLLHLGSMISNVYGTQSRSAFNFQKLNDAMDRLSDELQSQADQDCPGLHASDFYR